MSMADRSWCLWTSKILPIFASLFLLVCMAILVIVPPADGYEVSIYSAFPLIFWICLALSLSFSALQLVISSVADVKSRYWLISFTVIALATSVVILLPLIRGYFLSGSGDDVTHLGYINEIIGAGGLGDENVYPFSHVLAVLLSDTTGIQTRLLMGIVPLLFYMVYLLGLFLLARNMTSSIKGGRVTLAFASVPLFSYFSYLFLPTQFFLFLIPIVLVVFSKMTAVEGSYQYRYRVSLLLMIFGLPLLHPLGAAFLIFIFIIWPITLRNDRLKSHSQKDRCGSSSRHIRSGYLAPPLLVSVILLGWFSYFALFRMTVQKAFNWFLYGMGTPPIDELGTAIEKASLTFVEASWLIFKTVGSVLIFAGLSTLILILLLRRVFRRKTVSRGEIGLSWLFVSFALFFVLSLLGSFVMTGPSLRILYWALLFSTLLNGIFIWKLIVSSNPLKRKVLTGALCMLLVVSIVVGMIGVFPSPATKRVGIQVTESDWDGVNWFLYRKDSHNTHYINQFPYRAPDAVFGPDSPRPDNVGTFIQSSPHFGYTETSSGISGFQNGTYLIVMERDKLLYSEIWDEVGSYSTGDFSRLYFDQYVDLTYSNAGFIVWRVVD